MSRVGLQFYVSARPATQGSKKGFVRGGRAIVVDDNPDTLRPWREAVRATAVRQRDLWFRVAGPITVAIRFDLPRPTSAPKRKRVWPIGTRDDVDKLARAVLDALTDAQVWVQDGQVVDLRATKDYHPDGLVGALITLDRLGVAEPVADPIRSSAGMRTPAGGLTLTGHPPIIEGNPTS